MALQINQPFPMFFDLDGSPLDNGYIYIGTANANPETSPVTVYWDAGLTLPATQPLRTINGHISRSGTPSVVFHALDSTSVTTKNSRSQQVLYSPSVASASLTSVADAAASAAAAAASAVAADASADAAAASAASILTQAQLEDYLVKMRFPIGGVMPFASGFATPYGYLECDGAAVSRAAYPSLFSAIGTAYGVGDGVSTFNVPDLRAEFIRGWDHGRGIDPARAMASAQAEMISGHEHRLQLIGTTLGGVGNVSVDRRDTNGNGTATMHSSNKALASADTETRPRNVAMMYCIKAYDGIVDEAFATVDLTQSIIAACSDEVTALTTGTGKVTFRVPYAFTVSGVRASLTTAQTSGSIFTVNINKDGVSILSTKITIDNGEKTSTTALSPAVISAPALSDDCEITVDIDQIGDGTAKGLKVYLIGVKA